MNKIQTLPLLATVLLKPKLSLYLYVSVCVNPWVYIHTCACVIIILDDIKLALQYHMNERVEAMQVCSAVGERLRKRGKEGGPAPGTCRWVLGSWT